MKKRYLVLMLVMIFATAFCLGACGTTAFEDTVDDVIDTVTTDFEVDGSAYGYAGEDPIEAAVYKYMAEEVSKNYDKADVSIPTVNIINVDYTDPDDVLVRGDFWIDNYNINGDTLECVSGGDYPGVMHLTKGETEYVVNDFEVVADGSDWDSSAKELFGEYYDDFMAVVSDDEARAELRKITVSDYVNLNGLDINQFEDYGWPAVELYK